jgi:hypothetical protein
MFGKKHVGLAPTLTQPTTTPRVYCAGRTKPNNRNNLHHQPDILPGTSRLLLIRIKVLMAAVRGDQYGPFPRTGALALRNDPEEAA